MMPAELTVGPGGPGGAPRQMPACHWVARPGLPPPQLPRPRSSLQVSMVTVLDQGPRPEDPPGSPTAE